MECFCVLSLKAITQTFIKHHLHFRHSGAKALIWSSGVWLEVGDVEDKGILSMGLP